MSDQHAEIAEDAVDHLARAVHLPIDPAHRAGAVETFAGLLRMAALVMEFPLEDDVQQPLVYRP